MSVKKRFAYHKPSASAVEKLTKLREAFSRFEDEVEAIASEGSREKALFYTNLEQAALWINKHVTHNDPESVQDTDHAGTPLKLHDDKVIG